MLIGYDDPLTEASLLHPQSSNRFVSVFFGTDQRQTSVRQPELSALLETAIGCDNVYLAQNEFRYPSRRLGALGGLTCAFVDCDLIKTTYSAHSPEQVSGLIRLYCEDTGFPVPSLINSSGRGIHCKWLFNTPVSDLALPRWNAVERELCKQLKPFGADNAARDASRMLRLPGSINSRNGELCRNVWLDERTGAVSRYDFETLCTEILPYDREELREKRKARLAVKDEAEGRQGRSQNLWSAQQLWWHRLNDLRRLIELRGWQSGVEAGCRSNFLLIGATALSWGAGVTGKALDAEIRGLANEFCPDLPRSDVEATLRWVQQTLKAEGVARRYSSEKIVEMLDIGKGEEANLRTLISSSTRMERRRKRNTTLVREKRGSTPRSELNARLKARLNEAMDMRQQGLTMAQIAQAMGCSRDAIKCLLRRSRKKIESSDANSTSNGAIK